MQHSEGCTHAVINRGVSIEHGTKRNLGQLPNDAAVKDTQILP